MVEPDDDVRRAVKVVKGFTDLGQLLETLAILDASHLDDRCD